MFRTPCNRQECVTATGRRSGTTVPRRSECQGGRGWSRGGYRRSSGFGSRRHRAISHGRTKRPVDIITPTSVTLCVRLGQTGFPEVSKYLKSNKSV